MAWGKTDEEKAQITAEKQATQAAREQAKAEAAYWASPVGQAAQAKQRGDRFFQITIEASQLRGRSTDFLGPSSTSTTRRAQGVPDMLGQIEAVGWHLEHVGYVFVETGTNSRDKVLSSGAQDHDLRPNRGHCRCPQGVWRRRHESPPPCAAATRERRAVLEMCLGLCGCRRREGAPERRTIGRLTLPR